MATTTRAALRQRLSEALGDYFASSATANGSTTVIEDTALAHLSSDDDFCENWYVIVTESGHGALGEVRRVSDYDAANKRITVSRAFSAAINNGHDYELHRLDPTDKHNAINRALEDLFPYLYLPVRDKTLVVDDVLANADFETFSGGFTGWTAVNSPTVTQETSRVFHGASSAKVVSGGSAGQLTQTPTVNVREVTGRAAVFRSWAYATAASTARIRLDWDGSNFANSSYHSGADQWELLEVEATVPSTATQVKAICEVATNGTGYFDAARLTLGPISKYAIPTAILRGPMRVRIQYDLPREADDALYVPVDGAPTSGRRLLLEGMGLLTRPASDSATTEIGASQVNLVVAYAAMWLARRIARSPALAAQERDRYLADEAYWAAETERFKASPGIRMEPVPVLERNGWHVEEDSSGRYLVFNAVR